MRSIRFAGHLGAALVGVIVGGLVVLGVEGMTRTPSTSPSRQPSSGPIDVVPDYRTAVPNVMLAWSPLGLPAELDDRLDGMRGVSAATMVHSGLVWMVEARDGDRAIIERHTEGWAVPLEVAIVDPDQYARFVPRSERARILALDRDTALLSRSAASLRRAEQGASLTLSEGRRVKVAGVVSDSTAQGYEMLLAGPPPTTWSRTDPAVLALIPNRAARARVEKKVRGILGSGHVVRIRAEGETPYLRYGDAVLPQLHVKQVFGEFAARPSGGGTIQVDPRWRSVSIASQRVPLVGRVACHVAVFDQLRAALREVIAAGLSFTVNKEQFGGCYSARYINHDPAGRLSHHSWGMAIDLNVAENSFGSRPDQDRRLVEIFERHGFTWGGRWLIPDGMHFEWVRGASS
ncbi:MAG TPA: M15 family metallopeptidase [Actinomycetota bacterium]|nr:M15 family metallopeptidase [Actinomycetota bacterium]